MPDLSVGRLCFTTAARVHPRRRGVRVPKRTGTPETGRPAPPTTTPARTNGARGAGAEPRTETKGTRRSALSTTTPAPTTGSGGAGAEAPAERGEAVHQRGRDGPRFPRPPQPPTTGSRGAGGAAPAKRGEAEQTQQGRDGPRLPRPPQPPTTGSRGAGGAAPAKRGEAEQTQRGRDGSRFPRTHLALELVEMAGIEPASNGAEGGLLRAQSTSIFSAPEITWTSLRRAQSLLMSRQAP